MCTLAISLGSDRRWPVVVAANRDERTGRPSEGWALRTTASGVRWAGPRDAQAGGTWIGVSARGVVAALTNYHAPLEWYPDLDRRSRGDLVPLALAAGGPAEAERAMGALDAAAFNPFHLVVAGADHAFLWWYDGQRTGLARLGRGLHLVTETSPNGLGARADLVRARWPVDPSPARLRELLTLHAPPHPAAAATCIHQDPHYGTRSSAVLRLTSELGHAELYAADGRPCLVPLEDRSALLAELARSA
jgi:uncharacterized protein with NRDE domain